MPIVILKGKGAQKLKKHLNKEHPELKQVYISKKKEKKRR